VTAAELIAAREQLGLTRDAMGAELGLTPDIVDAWERGSVRIPAAYAQEIAWRVAAADRTAALASSGLPECSWIRVTEAQAPLSGREAHARYVDSMLAHVESCTVCLARERFLTERFPPMPPRPMPHAMGVLVWLAQRLERFPEWARPVVTGAVFFLVLTLIRVLLSIPRWRTSPDGWVSAVTALVTAAIVGALLGLLYSGYRTLRLRFSNRKSRVG
jgi:hypothetical protein